MNHTNSDIIIIGTNHHNALSMVRSFGEEGKNIILYIYGDKNSYISGSNYVKNISYFSTATETIDSVISLAESVKCRPVVIACSDEVSSLMDMRYEELNELCYFFNAGEAGRITSFMDKQKQLELAKECGFAVPYSIDTLPKNIDSEKIQYPCIVKPQASIYGGKNIAICHTQQELKDALENYNPKFNILIQEYIQKEYEIVILGMTFKSETIIPGFIHKHREASGGTTFSTVKPISELPSKVVEACKRMIQDIKYNGLWGIECIKQGDNYYFLELNMRNDATTYSMKVAGANLPLYYYNKVTNPSYTINDVSIESIHSMVEFNDFNFVLKQDVGLFKWIKEWKSSKCKYFYSKNDKVPYKHKKKEYIRFIIKKIFHV